MPLLPFRVLLLLLLVLLLLVLLLLLLYLQHWLQAGWNKSTRSTLLQQTCLPQQSTQLPHHAWLLQQHRAQQRVMRHA
jgi:hypothetical protein